MVDNNLLHLISVQNQFKLSEELYIIESGTQEHYRKHKYGPAVFNHHVLHYIGKGGGQYFLNERCYKLNEGDVFYCPPNETVYYYSDVDDPYAYTWVGFNGTKVDEYMRLLGLNADQPVKSYALPLITDYLNNIYHSLRKATMHASIKALASLYELFALLIENNKDLETHNNTNDYVQNAIAFIRQNYYYNIKVSDISKFLSLNTNYFSTLFKESTGRSPIDYLIDYRLEKACYLLEKTNFAVSKIAELTGFSCPTCFSIRFKKRLGVSPMHYRNPKLMGPED